MDLPFTAENPRIRHVIVLGANGFLGHRIVRRLREAGLPVEVEALDIADFDLTDKAAVTRLAARFTPATCIVHCAAVKRQLGDSAAHFMDNMAMVANVAEALAGHPVARLVFFSSTAVYGEDIANEAICEDTPFEPRTYYGLAKMAGEWILRKTFDAMPDATLGILRPAMIYGAHEPVPSYGPSLFLHDVMKGRETTLWGDGSEKRELVYVEDVIEIAARFALHDHDGPLNVASGESYTYRDALRAVEAASGRAPAVTSRPRTKDKVDLGFDAARIRRLFPGIRFTPLEEGVAAMHRIEYLDA